jgi:hypothetical protein
MVPAEVLFPTHHAGPINGLKIIIVIRRDVMARQALHASLTLTAVLTGYQPAAELFL